MDSLFPEESLRDDAFHLSEGNKNNWLFNETEELEEGLHLFNPELLLPEPAVSSTAHPCPLCGKNFSFPSKLARHLTSHSKTKEFSCPSCDKNFSRKDVLVLHSSQAHGSTRPSGNTLPCHLCPAFLKSQKTLERHLRSHESRSGTFSCPSCPKDFRDKRKYQMHARAHAAPRQGHHRRQRHVCSVCSKSFSQAGGLSKHVNRFHEKAVFFPCPHCEKSFPTSSQLEVHSRYHASRRPYPCGLCGAAFVEKGHRDRHTRRLHGSGQRPFPCGLCDKAFFEKYELNYHCREAHSSLSSP